MSDTGQQIAVGIDYASMCEDPAQGRMVRDIMARVGDKWSLLTIGALAAGPKRFSDLRAAIPGISQRMLTVTVRALARDGLVSRTAFGEVPPRVEYSLTDNGRTLIAPTAALAAWAIQNRAYIEASRASFDAHAERT